MTYSGIGWSRNCDPYGGKPGKFTCEQCGEQCSEDEMCYWLDFCVECDAERREIEEEERMMDEYEPTGDDDTEEYIEEVSVTPEPRVLPDVQEGSAPGGYEPRTYWQFNRVERAS